jgi:hypothetical protein
MKLYPIETLAGPRLLPMISTASGRYYPRTEHRDQAKI